VLELFYEEGGSGSARVLAFIEENGIAEFVRARDVAIEDARGDWERLRGSAVPALWDGERLYEGAEAVLARMMAFLDVGRAD
jgi:hypothetical protein